jgi:putative tricarboxylic transport membrane protein
MKSIAWRGNVDFYSGVLLVAIAAVALIYIRSLTIGTVLQMGPGYFPFGLALVLFGMGLCLIVKGIVVGGSPVGQFHLRPLVFVLLSFAAFGVLIERAGLIVAILAQVAVAHCASSETTWRESIATGVALAAASSVLFVWLLGIPVGLLP